MVVMADLRRCDAPSLPCAYTDTYTGGPRRTKREKAGGGTTVRDLRDFPDDERQLLAETSNPVCYHVDKAPATEMRMCGSPGQAAR